MFFVFLEPGGGEEGGKWKTIKESSKVSYALSWEARQPRECSLRHRIRSGGLRASDSAEKHATPKRGKTLSIPFFSSPPHCHPIFSCSWSCVYTASFCQGGDGGFCSAPTRTVLRRALDTEAAGREVTAAALTWPQTFMLSLKNVTLWRRCRLARDKLTATDYKSRVGRATEAEGASNTRPRVALRSCSAGDAARNGRERYELCF